MTKRLETIVFFGNERLATGVVTTAPTLRALIAAGYNVAAVISNYEQGKSRRSRKLEIADVAAQHNIPLLLPARPSDIVDELRMFNAKVGVLVAYGKIVPQSIIDLFPAGIINIHPSLLPLHRGPTPIESALLNGEQETGVSLMQLAKAMDAGPVYIQEKVSIEAGASKQDLADTLLTKGACMLIEHLPAILNGSLAPKPQDDERATYDNKIYKGADNLDWSKPAMQLEREIRAFLEWPKSRTRLAGKEVIITKAHVAAGTGDPGTVWRDGKQFGLYTGKDILVIDTLKPAGKHAMNAEAFLAGHGKALAA